MPSNTCKACGYENSSFSSDCESCGQPLLMSSYGNEFDTGRAAQTQTVEPPNRAYAQPPPPPAFDIEGRIIHAPVSHYRHTCIKCGSAVGVEVQGVRKDYTPPIVYLSPLISPLIMVILAMLTRVRHDLSLPFCRECWGKFEKANSIATWSVIGFILLLIGGFVGLLVYESVWPMIVGTLLGVGFAIFGLVNKKGNSPQYGKVDGKQVVIKDPVHGDVQFIKEK